MKKIICFGDSNTFGFNPRDGSRYDSNARWTGILANALGDEFKIAEEGCNNRTGFFLNPDGALQSGQKYLPQCLEKHQKFDIFIFALGTNDLQTVFKIDENIVKDGLKNIVNLIRKFSQNARIIIIPPVILKENILKGYFGCQFDEDSVKASVWIQNIYEIVAKMENCEFLDLNKYVIPSDIDGLHFDEESHKIIAKQITNQILGEKHTRVVEMKFIKSY